MDLRTNVEAVVESRPSMTCSFRRTGACHEVDGKPADTPCSTPGCMDWCHYEDCFARFCDASEFYPGLDTNPLREGLMVTFCQTCALERRQEYRDHQDLVRYYPNSDDGSEYDTPTTVELDSDDYFDGIRPSSMVYKKV